MRWSSQQQLPKQRLSQQQSPQQQSPQQQSLIDPPHNCLKQWLPKQRLPRDSDRLNSDRLNSDRLNSACRSTPPLQISTFESLDILMGPPTKESNLAPHCSRFYATLEDSIKAELVRILSRSGTSQCRRFSLHCFSLSPNLWTEHCFGATTVPVSQMYGSNCCLQGQLCDLRLWFWLNPNLIGIRRITSKSHHE